MGTELRRRTLASAPTEKESSATEPATNRPKKHYSWQHSWLWRIPVVLFYSFWFLFGILVLRKTHNAITAVRYVKSHATSVSIESIENSAEFDRLIRTLDAEFTRPPAFLLLNQYALNMTYNFLCNTASLEGVHDRLIFVTLDSVARDELTKHWPTIRQFYWPTPSLYKPFSFAEGPYQTIYLLRSNLAVSLLRRGKSFWMMQQDTFWRKNLFDLELEDNMSYDALFDQIGIDDKSMRAEWVNGANFFIRANNDTLEFFERLSDKLAHWYTPDMGVMIHQCHTWTRPRCAYIPHKIAHSWEWMYTKQQEPPYIMQLDCETDGGSKLMQLGKFGFHFITANGTCSSEKVSSARARMEAGKVDVSYTKMQFFPSWGRLQFKAYWFIVDCILWTPIIGPFLKPYLAQVGYILMITILLHEGRFLSRQYTPTNVDRNGFEIPIKIYEKGRMTQMISDWELGTSVEWRGPFMENSSWKEASHLLLVAGGTGIAPFVRIVDPILSNEDTELRIRLLYCVRGREEVLFKQRLKDWTQYWNVNVVLINSREEEEEQSGNGLITTIEGRLTKELFENQLNILQRNNREGVKVVVCGSNTLEKDIVNYSKKSGVEDSNILRFTG